MTTRRTRLNTFFYRIDWETGGKGIVGCCEDTIVCFGAYKMDFFDTPPTKKCRYILIALKGGSSGFDYMQRIMRLQNGHHFINCPHTFTLRNCKTLLYIPERSLLCMEYCFNIGVIRYFLDQINNIGNNMLIVRFYKCWLQIDNNKGSFSVCVRDFHSCIITKFASNSLSNKGLELHSMDTKPERKAPRNKSWNFSNLISKLVGNEGLEPPTSSV